jgi:hypothetical protein
MKTTLSVLLARDAPVGVILRRGPSKQVLMVRWDLEHDTFETGEWLEGRVYEDCCDLSPRGDLLLYLASKHTGEQQGTWTAISRPPSFTALALWPLNGTWQGGGGVFLSDSQVLLHQIESPAELAAGFSLPGGLEAWVQPYGSAFEDRMSHDRWHLVEKRTPVYGSKVDVEEVWLKFPLRRSPGVGLRFRIHVQGEAPVLRTYTLVSESSTVDLGAADWMDWCPKGDLLFARDGRIYRTASQDLTRPDGHLLARELIDLSALRFELPNQVPGD